MLIFNVNDVYVEEGSECIYRILYLDISQNQCVSILLGTDTLNLRFNTIKELENNLINGDIYIEETKYNFISNEKKLSQYRKDLLDKAWDIIAFINKNVCEPHIFEKKIRFEIVNKVVEEFQVSKKHVYKQLRRYWQGGKIREALISDLDKCGGRGKQRVTSTKLGRPNYIAEKKPELKGVNLGKEDKDIFDKVIKRYKHIPYRRSIYDIYNLMIEQEYSVEKIVDGRLVKEVLPNFKIPTFHTFKAYYYKTRDKNLRESLINCYGEKEFKLNRDALLSNTASQAFGPGHIYEIDATIPPVYLVNRIKKDRGIGKPVLYFVIDVFSKMIVGLHVGLESPSWNGASSALYNCIENKKNYCLKFGIEIKNEEWPNSSLPKRLLADRGELIYDQADQLVKYLNIEVENTPSYMGKNKGNVEQSFRLSEKQYVTEVLGSVNTEIRKRGERDYRKDACLDIHEFTKIVIRTVIHHNKKRMDNYPMTQKMVDSNIYPTPINIWEWGIKNISGSINNYPKDYIKLHLMREGIAHITEKGIIFCKGIYMCDIAIKEDWFVIARNKGTWKIDIRYDARNMDEIYILSQDKKQYIVATLDKESLFFNKTYSEVIDYNKYIKERNLINTDRENQNNVDMISGLKHDLKLAVKNTKENNSNKLMIENIRENRKKEIIKYNNALSLNNKVNKVKLEDDLSDGRDYIYDLLGGN